MLNKYLIFTCYFRLVFQLQMTDISQGIENILKQYKQSEFIGQGGFGITYKVIDE